MTKLRTVLIVGLVLGAFSGFPAFAEFGGAPDKVRFDFGGTWAYFDTSAGAVEKDAGLGVSINFEDVFDLALESSFYRGDGSWRIKERHLLDFGYEAMNRKGGKVIDDTLEWRGYTIDAGGFVTGRFKSGFLYAAYRYDFMHKDDVRISGSAGLTYLDLETGLSTEGTVTGPDGSTETGTFESEASIAYPVPLIGLRVEWAVGKNLSMEFWTRALPVNLPKLRGNISEASIRLHWFMSKHVGLAAGWDRTQIGIRRWEGDDFTGSFVYNVQGFSGYVSLAF